MAKKEVPAGEPEHVMALDRMAALIDELNLDPSGLVVDIRDFMLGMIKARPKPWSGTSQSEQQDVITTIQGAAEDLVRKVIEAVASKGSDSVRVLLTGFTVKNDAINITGKAKAAEDEEENAIHLLHTSVGKHVMLTAATLDDYRGDREAETDADEPEIDFESGGEDEDEELDTNLND